jgi:hypothetical protein
MFVPHDIAESGRICLTRDCWGEYTDARADAREVVTEGVVLRCDASDAGFLSPSSLQTYGGVYAHRRAVGP